MLSGLTLAGDDPARAPLAPAEPGHLEPSVAHCHGDGRCLFGSQARAKGGCGYGVYYG